MPQKRLDPVGGPGLAFKHLQRQKKMAFFTIYDFRNYGVFFFGLMCVRVNACAYGYINNNVDTAQTHLRETALTHTHTHTHTHT